MPRSVTIEIAYDDSLEDFQEKLELLLPQLGLDVSVDYDGDNETSIYVTVTINDGRMGDE